MPNEPLYQVGICPNCSKDAQQQLLFGTYDCSEPLLDFGALQGYGRVETLTLFRCMGCRNNLLYSTKLEDGFGSFVDELDRFDPSEEVGELSRDQFLEISTLLHSTQVERTEENSILDPSTPEAVKLCYETGTRVRPISKDLYALQLRKTLEAVCKDKGASEYLASGKRAMLWQQIDELEKQNVVGHFISEAAHKLKEISNTGAHYSERAVTDGDIRKLEHLLGLITNYVYGN